MSKKNSILFQITLFFIIIFIIINLLIVAQFLVDNESNKLFHMKRYFQSTRIIKNAYFNKESNSKINERLKLYSTTIARVDLNYLIKNAKKITLKEDIPINIFVYNNKKYINPKPPEFKPEEQFLDNSQFKSKKLLRDKDIIFVDNLDEKYFKSFWFIVLVIIDILLIWFYYFLYKKLLPLYTLKDEIVSFSKGNLNINTQTSGKDEISQVSNEFNYAIKKIRNLDNSRKLFLRNILHELKTPINKGRLISDTLEDNKKKTILQKTFLRLEVLLEEFIKLEQLTSGKIDLSKKEYRIIDLLDQAIDLLLVDKSKINIYPKGTKVFVDFEFFSIALKNLIDNSIKYTIKGKPEIFIKEDSLIIKNQAPSLKKPFKEYLKPFNREYESIDKGLGLGLYITNSIIKSHEFKLYYQYSKGFHIFKIQFEIPKD